MSKICQTVKITHESGLHARASTEFVRLAQRFQAEVSVSRPEGMAVDGKSIIAVMTLGAQLGDEIVIETVGPDAMEALEALANLVRLDFHGV
ncbi:MAG: HPr family phosphocarrier protein [Planctomycetota bacterium]|nr:HPr family phosphocarrier protein [Planctomycetota bacterium]